MIFEKEKKKKMKAMNQPRVYSSQNRIDPDFPQASLFCHFSCKTPRRVEHSDVGHWAGPGTRASSLMDFLTVNLGN